MQEVLEHITKVCTDAGFPDAEISLICYDSLMSGEARIVERKTAKLAEAEQTVIQMYESVMKRPDFDLQFEVAVTSTINIPRRSEKYGDGPFTCYLPMLDFIIPATTKVGGKVPTLEPSKDIQAMNMVTFRSSRSYHGYGSVLLKHRESLKSFFAESLLLRRQYELEIVDTRWVARAIRASEGALRLTNYSRKHASFVAIHGKEQLEFSDWVIRDADYEDWSLPDFSDPESISRSWG